MSLFKHALTLFIAARQDNPHGGSDLLLANKRREVLLGVLATAARKPPLIKQFNPTNDRFSRAVGELALAGYRSSMILPAPENGVRRTPVPTLG